MDNPVTILDLAVHRGVESENGNIPASEFYRVNLDFIGGCCICHATIAAYNAYPSKSGYWKCGDCIGDDGWYDVAECDKDIRGQ